MWTRSAPTDSRCAIASATAAAGGKASCRPAASTPSNETTRDRRNGSIAANVRPQDPSCKRQTPVRLRYRMAARLVRVFTFLLAVAQLALPAALSVADKALVDLRGTVTHIESTAGKQCKPPHAADCCICRYLSAAVGKAGSSPPPILRSAVSPHATAMRVVLHAAVHQGVRSRAPPSLLA